MRDKNLLNYQNILKANFSQNRCIMNHISISFCYTKRKHGLNLTGILCTILISLMFSACSQTKPGYGSPAGYDLTKPEKFSLPTDLHEISGLTFNWQSDTILAVEDENGSIYRFVYGQEDLILSKFAKKGDYEGIALNKDYIIVLRSDGSLFTIAQKDLGAANISAVKEWKDLIPKEEYESIAYDPENGLIYVLCKKCSLDSKKQQTSVYIFELSAEGKIKLKGNTSIELKQIPELKNKDFRPSALAKNPNTGEWYILSSINKLLVISDKNWKIKSTYPLDPGLFNQPEGIAFDSDNNLYISNEGGELGNNGNIIRFKLNP